MMKHFAGLALVPLLAGRLVCVGQVAAVGPVSTPPSFVQAPLSLTESNAPGNPESLPDSPSRVLLTATQPELAGPDATAPLRTSSSLDFGLASAAPAETAWVRPTSARYQERTADSKYFLLNGGELGMGLFDVALTQHCIANQHCREGNPLMPSSLGGQLAFNFGYAAYSSFISYRLKKHHSQLWFLAPVSGIAAHSIGVASGFKHY